jgi:hypothetical protein
MEHIVIRYQTKPEATQRNTELIEDVFRELGSTAPEGVGYLVLRTEDGTFFHIVSYVDEDANVGITGLPAFKAFTQDGEERRAVPPVRAEVTVVGNYRMLAGEA